MDTEALVDHLIDDGQKLVDQRPARGFPITAALWLKSADEGKWQFYIVSSAVDTDGLTKAYGKLHALIRAMPKPFWIDPLEVKLISPIDPIAKDVLDIQRRFPGAAASPIRWEGITLGNVSIEGAYLYPLPASVAV